MAINKKLIHFDMTKQLFMSNANGLNNLTKPTNGIVGNIPYYSVVFLKDGYIWTHGHFINGTGIADSVSGNATISWSKITDKPSTFTPSAHTQAYTTLTGSGTTANQAIVSSGTANGWTLKTLGSRAFDSTSYLPLAGGTMNAGAMIVWQDWGQWGAPSPTYPKANGGLQWSGTSDWIKLFAEETAPDDLRLILQCGDDTSPQFNIRNYEGITTVSLHSNGTITGTSIINSGSNNNYVLLGGGGTKALSDFLYKSGGILTGNLILKGDTTNNMTYSGNVHPCIIFDNLDSSQNVSLIFTDYDSYRSPAGLKLVGNQGNEWFEAPVIYQNGTKVSLEGHTHNYITSLGDKNASDLSSTYPNGLSVAGIYNNGYPFTYGSTITANGNRGYFQIAGQWNDAVSSLTDPDHPTEMYIRGRRDSYDVWTTWTRVLTNRNWSSVITLPTKSSWNYDDRYSFSHQPHSAAFAFNIEHNSNYVTFDGAQLAGAPNTNWFNGFVSTHNHYLSSYLINQHRTADWYVGYSESKTAPTWYKLIHSGNYTNYTVTKTGSGASGTWGINISGTATDADKLDGYHYNNLPYHPINGSWKPSSLSSYTRHWGWAYNSAEAGLASNGTEMQIYTDGKFWQREGAYYCLDNGNTYVSSGTGIINGTTITQVANANRLKVYTETSNNTNVYRIIGQQTLNGGWANKGLVLAVASRHSGIGIYTIHYGAEISNGWYADTNHSGTDTYYTFDRCYCKIRYFGDTFDTNLTKIICHVKPASGDNPKSAVFTFFLHSFDGSSPRISILQDWGNPFELIENGATMSTIDTSVYGQLKETTVMNESNSCTGNSATATKATQDSDGNQINTTYLKRSGGTMTGNITIGNSTFYASGTNGGINSLAVADDCILGDCNIGGHLGLRSLNTTNAGISFYNSSGGSLGRFTVNSSGTPTWNDTAFSLTNHNHDATYFKHCSSNNTDPITGLYNGYGVCMTTTSGINGNWWHVFSAGWDNTSDWISQLALPTENTIRGAWFRIRQSSTNSAWIRLHDTQNTYVSNNKGFINNTEITYVNTAGNADTVDGYHESSFLRHRVTTSTNQEGTLWSQIGIKQYNDALPDSLSGTYTYGQTITFATTNARFEIYASYLSSDNQGLYYRSGWDNDKKPWRRILDSYNSSVGKSGETLTVTINGTSQSLTNTTYSAGTGLTLSGTTFYNSGVRTTTINGNYLRVNTNGTNTDLTIPYASYARELYNSVSVESRNTATYPWRRIATTGVITGDYTDEEATILVRQQYDGGVSAILKISLRTNTLSSGYSSSANAIWLVRNQSYPASNVKIALYSVQGKAYADVYLKVGQWERTYINVIANHGWTFKSSNEDSNSANPVEAYTSIEAAATALYGVAYTSITDSYDAGIVSRAISDYDGNAIHTTYLKRSGGSMTNTNVVTNLNADLLDGMHLMRDKTNQWGTIPFVRTDGVMEVGKYIDFHNDNTGSSYPDYSTRLWCTGNHGNNVRLSSASGTLALTSDNVASASKLQTARTLWGQSFDGTGNVSGDMTGVGGITFTTLTGANARNILYQQMADNDYFRIRCGATASNGGWVELATADDGNEPIYVRQYTGAFATVARTLTLLDGNGNTSIPKALSVGGALNVTGATTLSSTLSVSNNTTIGGTLGVTGTTTLKSTTTINANTYISGETYFSAADAFRLNYGSYGVIHRNDGGSYWILLTNKNEQNGGFNSLRPFHIDLSTGTVYMDNNAIIDNLAFTQCNISMGGRVNATCGYDLNTNDYYGLYFKSKNSSSTGILFNDDGNVGINTLSPLYKLDVNGTLRVSDTITATSLATSYTDTWSDGTHTHPWYGYDHRYANTGVYSTTITDYYGMTLKTLSGNISITNGGNVGIGTFTPLRKLHVIGEAIFGESGYVASQGTGSGYSGTWVGQGFMELSAPNPYIDFHANKSTADFTSRLIQWSDKVRLEYVSSNAAYNGYILTCEGNHHNPVILGIFDLKRSGPGSTIWTLDNICGPCVFTLANNWGSDATFNSNTYWTIPSNLLRVEINGTLGANYTTKTVVKAASCIGTVMTRWINNQPVVSNRSHEHVEGCSVECLCTDKAPGTNLYYDSNSPGKYIYITGARPYGYDDGTNGLSMDQFRRTGNLSYLRVRFVVYGWLE